jgi:endonuclease/exonuclease/phosphatase family metal-dependent hydrolase
MPRALGSKLLTVALLAPLGCETTPEPAVPPVAQGGTLAAAGAGGSTGASGGAAPSTSAGQAGVGQGGNLAGTGGSGGVGGADASAGGSGGGAGGNDAPFTLRILTFNIKTGSLSSLETIAEIIEASGADVAGLQEVDKGTQRSAGVDQPAVLAQLTDMQPFFAPGLADFDGGQYGVAALISHDLRVLSATPHQLDQPAAGEARAALEIELARLEKNADLPDFVFMNTHWDLVLENRVAQAQHVNSIGMTHASTPLLLVGDLNARSGSQPIDILLDFWTPADEAVFGIDWLVHRSDRWQVSGVRELTADDHPQASTASDHVPVIATYTLFPD